MEPLIRKTIYEVKRLSPAEREKAMEYQGMYPPGVAKAADAKRHQQIMETPCMVCHFRWMQHKGLLCPKMPGYMHPTLNIPISPTMGDTLFVADEAYLLPEKTDFDVV